MLPTVTYLVGIAHAGNGVQASGKMACRLLCEHRGLVQLFWEAAFSSAHDVAVLQGDQSASLGVVGSQ